MSDFIDKLNKNILSTAQFSQAKNVLFESYIDYLTNEEVRLDKFAIKKLVTVIQYFFALKIQKLKMKGLYYWQ